MALTSILTARAASTCERPQLSPTQAAIANARASLHRHHLRYHRVTRTDVTALLDHLDNLEFEVSNLKGTSWLTHPNAA